MGLGGGEVLFKHEGLEISGFRRGEEIYICIAISNGAG